MTHPLLPLPVSEAIELETPAVLKMAARAHRRLAELKGAAGTIPNERILIDTLGLQEAKDSSEIENIITTEDELFQVDEAAGQFPSLAAKEVHLYSTALKIGFERVRRRAALRLDDVLAIQTVLVSERPGLRRLPGTVLKNRQTGETIYEPPQSPEVVASLMGNFLHHFNLNDSEGLDPLVQMAILHYQFESIHPFYDGNGRTGRILNLLYLVRRELLDLPVLYLSRSIVREKATYYQGFQKVRHAGDWEGWILFLLRAVEETSCETLAKVQAIRLLMSETKARLRQELPKMYSQELLNNLFRHPYTKIELIERDLHISRPTAIKYLNALGAAGFVRKIKAGRNNYYINQPLLQILSV